MYFLVATLLTGTQTTLLPLYTSGFPKRPASLPGANTPSAGRTAKAGACGDTWVTQPGRAHERVFPNILTEGAFRDALFQHTGGGRGSLQREGTYRLAHQVTRPESRLRSSAPRVSSLGPGAGPRSAGWRSRGRRRTGGSGRPRSPLKSARSQLLWGPRGHVVGAGPARAPSPLRAPPGREGTRALPCKAVQEQSWDAAQDVRSLRTQKVRLWLPPVSRAVRFPQRAGKGQHRARVGAVGAPEMAGRWQPGGTAGSLAGRGGQGWSR